VSFALVLSDFSTSEGILPARQGCALARALGYDALALWDPGLHGWPALREEGLRAGLKPLIGARFTWRGEAFGALPFSDSGYAALCRLFTDQAHGREGVPPPTSDCALLAETLAGAERLAREGLRPVLLGHGRNSAEVMAALARKLPVVAPQVLRFRTPLGLEFHRLKRAIATQGTLPRTEALWDPRDAAVPRAAWEARFPYAEPRVARVTEALRRRLEAWEPHWGSWVMPEPQGCAGLDLDALLEARVRAALPERYLKVTAAVESRLRMELELIRRKRFAGYFLSVHDIVRAANVSRTCGRGSGAASLVSYVLQITNVDPVATNLMFERFLSDARTDPPDLDIDFAWDERDDVIQAVFETHGRDRVAMVANHVFFQPRSALRAVAMAHGRPESELKTLARLVRGWDGGLDEALAHPAWAPLVSQAKALLGQFHQLSVHPGGTVIAPGPMWAHVPFQPAPAKENVAITHWDKDGIEGYGLVKIDLLGNRSLAVVRDALKALGDRAPRAIEWSPREDPVTQALLAKGDSIGVFYVESPATRQLQQRVGRGDFETLVMHSSLIRPAAHRWIDTYVKRIRGEEAYTPSHPALGQLLSESHGVLVYQEDVVRVGMALAGWTHEEADKLRKCLGKPDCTRRLSEFEAAFRAGCARQGIPSAVVDETWDMVQTFRGYSFCKPHSASYAQVSFESAWLKAHHPAHFFAAVITNQGGFYPAIAYLGDARRHRLVVRGPDANASELAYTAEGDQGLRVGLMAVKGAKQADLGRLLEDRWAHGPFESLEDLLARVPMSLPTVEALVAVRSGPEAAEGLSAFLEKRPPRWVQP